MPIADQQVTMDRLWPLPYEMHLEIFRKLSLKDIRNRKLVSKSIWAVHRPPCNPPG